MRSPLRDDTLLHLPTGQAGGPGVIVPDPAGNLITLPFDQVLAAIGGAPDDATYLTETNETADLPNSRRVVAGTNITFDDSVPGVRTVSASASSSSGSSAGGHLHGLQRMLGDGATTTFNLLDIAEYLEHVGVNGAFLDPLLFALSADRSQIVFSAAPGAGQVVTMEYVILNA